MKTVLLLLSLLIGGQALAWTQRQPLPIEACAVHNPYGIAKTKKDLIGICRQGYFSAYDPSAKIPNFVAYTLTPERATGCVERSDAFVADQSIKNGPGPEDYVATGFDKGHLAPAGDMSWDQQVEFESFLMTNMTPQAGSLNRGIWKLLESSVRGWVVQSGADYTVYSGGVYGPGDRVIGRGVVVPRAYYKIVINNRTKEIAGWWFPHVPPYPNLGNDLTKFRLQVKLIEKQSGIDYKYPRKAVELEPGKEWPVDFGKLANSKRSICK